MIETLLDEAERAFQNGERQKGDRLVQQLAQFPGDVVSIMLEALRHRSKVRQLVPLLVIRRIGYPKNELALPALFHILGDGNHPSGHEAGHILLDMGPDALTPHLIRAFLEKGEPYHTPTLRGTTWPWDVEGICHLIAINYGEKISNEYALRCCPVINILLNQIDCAQPDEEIPDIEVLLDVVKKAGDQVSYVIPTLITLVKKHRQDNIGRRAEALLFSYPQRELEPYKLTMSQKFLDA